MQQRSSTVGIEADIFIKDASRVLCITFFFFQKLATATVRAAQCHGTDEAKEKKIQILKFQ